MTDLFALSHLIQNSAYFTRSREMVYQCYLELARKQSLDVLSLLQALQIQIPDLGQYLQQNFSLYKEKGEETVKLRLQGWQFVCYGEELYPHSCYWMQDPPLALSYWGAPCWLAQRSLAVVGSREPSSESLLWMEKEFGAFCETDNPCVVSGGARGVDQKSHALALRKRCLTIVVLPSGLGALYPDSLKEWVKPILDGGGCLLSEYRHDLKMHKYLFHHRNRLIAALGCATLLVEARRRSGTFMTASQSVQMGRAVAVVPGHPLDPHFGGSLDLLSEGAFPVRDLQDLRMFFASELRGAETTPAGLGVLGRFFH